MNRRMLALVLSGFAALASPSSAKADGLRHPPQVGVVDEVDAQAGRSLAHPQWEQALVLSALVQLDPDEGQPATQATEVRVLRDGRALYIGARLFDADPAGIVANEMLRDASLDGDDMFRVVLDPFARGREGYLFEVNPRGARRDALLEGDRILNYDWDGRWTATAEVDEAGWWVIMRIPFTTLAHDTDIAVWGLNVERNLRRRQERSRWFNARRGTAVTEVSLAGRVSGFAGLSRSLGLEVVPNLRVARSSGGGSSRDSGLEAGVDANYRLRNSFTVALTVNTDFAEAEVDAREVNLTRFPLSFPEKREFFLRDAAFFRFGGINYSPYPYFSRRIGLDATGVPVPLDAGVRLTGREGPWTVGALGVRVGDSATADASTLGLVRLARNVGERATVGMIHTRGEPRANARNQLSGIDMAWLDNDSRFGVLEARAWAMRSSSDLAGGSDDAFGVQLRLPGEPWQHYTYVGQVGERFDPGLGFVRRRGIRELTHSSRYRWRFSSGPLRFLDYVIDPIVVTDLNGRVQSSAVDLPEFYAQTPRGGSVFFKVAHVREVLGENFEIRPGNVIAEGDYRWRQTVLTMSSSQARPWRVTANWSSGGFYDGDREDVALSLSLRPWPGSLFTASGERRRVSLPEGDFQVDLLAAGARVSLSPALNLSAQAQYDNVSGVVGFNARFRWLLGDDNAFFVVYERNQDWLSPGRPVVAEQGLVKLSWAFRF